MDIQVTLDNSYDKRNKALNLAFNFFKNFGCHWKDRPTLVEISAMFEKLEKQCYEEKNRGHCSSEGDLGVIYDAEFDEFDYYIQVG